VLTVLLVRFSSIGDILLTTPLVRVLRRRHPDARLVFVTKRAHVPLVADNPHLSSVVALEPGESLTHLAARLRPIGATHGLDLHGSLRSRALRLLVPGSWSGYRKRRVARSLLIALKHDLYGDPVPVAERYFEAARRLDVAPDDGPPEFHLGAGAGDRVARWLAEQGLADTPLAALAPGAAHATKRWPIAHWIALAERLRAAGLTSVVVGGPDDRGAAQQLSGHAHGAAGALSLQETGALLARARGHLGRHRRDAHGDRRWDPGHRAVRSHRPAIRVLSLPRARHRTRAAARLPAVLRHGLGSLPAGAPPLPRRSRPTRRGPGGRAARRVSAS
jgi:heptosyltransferase-2